MQKKSKFKRKALGLLMSGTLLLFSVCCLPRLSASEQIPPYHPDTMAYLITQANAKVEADYTTPSFTELKRRSEPLPPLQPKVYTNFTSDRIGTFQNIDFVEGGFSGMYPVAGNDSEFYIVSDRGVNIDAKNANCSPTYDKLYAFPDYAPKVHRVRIDGDSVQILETLTLKRPDGTTATGLLNPAGFGSTATEIAFKDTISNCANVASVYAPKDVWGIDAEGIVIGSNNDFWICEEGGASIWNVDANGKVIKRYSPYANLSGAEPQDVAIDTVFKYRKNNRGFEGIAITPNGKIYSIIQSSILYPTKNDGESSYVHRILEIDPVSGQNRMFAYLNPGVLGTGSEQIKAKDWKIGDMAAINDSTFLVLEQGVAGAHSERNIYVVNINQATAITSGLYDGKTIEQLKDSAGLAGQGIRPVQKTLFLNLMENSWPAELDKAEGLAIINDSTIVVCNDNDYGQSSPAENGIAIPNNTKSHIFVYTLPAERKLDNFVPRQSVISACDTVSQVTVSQITMTSAHVAWTADAGQEQWQVVYNVQNSSTENTLLVDNTPSVSLDNLTANTTYEVSIRALCGNTYSSWSTKTVFTTQNTGIEEAVTEHIHILLTPNPARNKVTLKAEGIHSSCHVAILSLTGAALNQQAFDAQTTNSIELDISGLAKGLYFVQLQTNQGKKYTQKLVIL